MGDTQPLQFSPIRALCVCARVRERERESWGGVQADLEWLLQDPLYKVCWGSGSLAPGASSSGATSALSYREPSQPCF